MDRINEQIKSVKEEELNNDLKSNGSHEISDDEYFSSSHKNGEESKEFHSKYEKTNIPFRTRNQFRKSDFEILGLLGRGTTAKVVKAMLLSNNSIYAIKIIRKQFIENVVYSL